MEKLIKSSNGQWALTKGELADIPTPSNPRKGGKGTNEMAKEETVPGLPKPTNPRKGGKGTNEMAKEEKDDSTMLFSQLEAIEHHIKEIKESMKPSENAPDWLDAKITEAAKNLSDVAHYIMGTKAKD